MKKLHLWCHAPFDDIHVFDHFRKWFIHRMVAFQFSNHFWIGIVVCRDDPQAFQKDTTHDQG